MQAELQRRQLRLLPELAGDDLVDGDADLAFALRMHPGKVHAAGALVRTELFALAPVLYLVVITVGLGYTPFHGRYLIPAVALGAATWGLVLLGSQSFHDEFGYLDFGRTEAVGHLALGKDPLGYLTGPNSSVAVVNLIYLPTAFLSGLAVTSALILDLIVLVAMVARIGDLGFTPNRTAALGLNLLLLVNLAGAARSSARFIGGQLPFHHLERWQTSYLPVFLVWTGAVVVLLPPMFAFE